MRITHGSAVELEAIVRSVFSCERYGMGGYINSDHFVLAPFDAALIALAPLWQRDDNHLVEDFLFKWDHLLRDGTTETCDIRQFIQELRAIVDTLLYY